MQFRTVPPSTAHVPAIWRILAAMLYDTFLVVAIIMIWGFIVFALNHGEIIQPNTVMGYILQMGILSILAGFFTFFWSRQGQTLGMRAWRLIVVDQYGHPPSVGRALLRWTMALLTLLPCGLGLWWRWLDVNRRSLYDLLSGTSIYVLDRNPYR